MWLDGHIIPDDQVQSYLDRQKQLYRNIGVDAIAKSLSEIIYKQSDEIERLKKELAVQKRRASYYKNRSIGVVNDDEQRKH